MLTTLLETFVKSSVFYLKQAEMRVRPVIEDS